MKSIVLIIFLYVLIAVNSGDAQVQYQVIDLGRLVLTAMPIVLISTIGLLALLVLLMVSELSYGRMVL